MYHLLYRVSPEVFNNIYDLFSIIIVKISNFGLFKSSRIILPLFQFSLSTIDFLTIFCIAGVEVRSDFIDVAFTIIGKVSVIYFFQFIS